MPAPPTPPAKKPGRFRRGVGVFLRRGSGHTFGVLHNVCNVVLLALVVLLASVSLRDELPVPKFVRDRIQQEFAARGFAVSVYHAEIDLTGRILAQDLTLAPARFGGPVLSAGRVFVELDRLKLLAGRVELMALDAEDVRVICPASLSPSGEAHPLVEIASLRVTQHAGVWRVPGIAATIGPVQVIAHGMYYIPARETPAPPPDVNRLLEQFATLAPRLVRDLKKLDALEQPRVELEVRGGTDRPIVFETSVSVAGWHDERVGLVQGLRARTHVTLRGAATTAPVRLLARIDRVERPDGLAADDLELAAEWFAFPTAKNYLPWQVHVAAAHVIHPKGRVTAPVLAIFPLAYPLVDLTASVVIEGEPVTLAAEADVRTRSGVVEVHCGVGRTWLARASEMLKRDPTAIVKRDPTEYATITTPPDVTARATIDAGLKLRGVDFRVITPPFVARHVALDRARVRGHVDRQGLRIDHLEFSRGTEWGRGTYESDFTGRDYRFMIDGSIRPMAIASWYGPWWGRFWHDYEFKGAPPVFNLDAHGNWLRPEPILMTGSGRAENVVIRGVPCDAVRTRLFVRPNYFDLFDATILRPEGRIDGETRMRYVRGDPLPVWQDFRFSSTADLVDLARIFGKGGEELLAPYRYTVPPEVSLVGTVTRQEKQYDVQLELGLNTAEEFRYLDFPLAWLTTRASIHNRQVVLPEIYAGYANGVLTGNATADNGQLTFDAKLTNADFDLATKIYSDYVDRNFPTPPEPIEPGSIVREDYGGKLSLTLAAKGPITNLKAFEGQGDLSLTDARLYKLRVIGLFSDITGIGALGFTDANGPLQVRRDQVLFPDLRVTGNTARIEAAGSYSLQDGGIDFRVRMKPLRESPGFITKIFGLVVNPLTNLLFEAHVTGTLRNPKRTVTFLAPRAPDLEPAPVPEAEVPPPAVPVPATPADETPPPAETPADVGTETPVAVPRS